jgi:peptidoglycan/LPS O-acetylase OafA/YrhL
VLKGSSGNLDLLRAIAVLLVLAQHLLRRMDIEHALWVPTSSLGLFGVLLFFVHTCLVLMLSMERSGLSGLALFGNFYIRRFFRIYPLSVLTVFTALGLHLGSDLGGFAGLSHSAYPGNRVALGNFFLIQNLLGTQSIVNVLWSLPFELQMYLVLPFLFLWQRGKQKIWQLLVLWGFSVLLALVQPMSPGLRLLSILLFLPNFLPGVIAYVSDSTPRIPSFWWPVFILSLVTLFTLFPHASVGWILCLALGLLIPLFQEIQSLWLRWIANRIAKYSYGIYLSHQFCIWFAFGVTDSHAVWITIPAFLAFLIGVPIILYHAIEKPMIDVGLRLGDRYFKA